MSRSRCRAAAASGLAATVLALLVPVIGARGESGYSHVSQFISELGAVGAANAAWVSAAGFAPIGGLVLAFLAFASAAFPRSRWRTAGVLCLGAIGVGYLVSAVFPCDAGCPASGSFSQSIHNVFGFLEYAGALAGLLLLAAAFRRSPGWHRLAAPSVVAAGFLAVGFFGMLVPGFEPVRGVSQRIAEGAIFSWIAGMSLFLLRSSETGGGSRRSSDLRR